MAGRLAYIMMIGLLQSQRTHKLDSKEGTATSLHTASGTGTGRCQWNWQCGQQCTASAECQCSDSSGTDSTLWTSPGAAGAVLGAGLAWLRWSGAPATESLAKGHPFTKNSYPGARGALGAAWAEKLLSCSYPSCNYPSPRCTHGSLVAEAPIQLLNAPPPAELQAP